MMLFLFLREFFSKEVAVMLLTDETRIQLTEDDDPEDRRIKEVHTILCVD